MTAFICSRCHQSYPEVGLPYRCPDCGGLFTLSGPLPFKPGMEQDLPGIWRYRETFLLPRAAPVITLGEGDTPLIQEEILGKQVFFKLESFNPSGSFKDRGTAVLLSRAAASGISEVVEDSSGNAGASLGLYASRAGIQAKIYFPAMASGPKRAQIERSGAEMVPVPGPRSRAAEAVLQEAEQGAVYASHAYLPLGSPGIATIAYEVWRQMPSPPGSVLVPVGHGSLLLGLFRGFRALREAGLIRRIPRLYGVQAAACDPLVQAVEQGLDHPADIKEGETLADGVKIACPVHGEEILAAVSSTQGKILRVEEAQIKMGRERLAAIGIDAEWTAALIWEGLIQTAEEAVEPILGIISGHGWKTP